MNWFEILHTLNGIERHYLKMGWDYESSERWQELIKFCFDNQDKLSKDFSKPYLVPLELFWKIHEIEYGFNKRDNTIKEKGGDDARLLH